MKKISFEKFLDIYNNCTKEKYDFIMINVID